MLKKLVIHTALLAGLLALAFTAMHFVTAPVQAQSSGALTSLTPVFSPAAINATATCVTTACPTFTYNGMCTGMVRITGTNSALSIVSQASNDAGTTYSPIAIGVVGAGITGNPGSLTTSIITANGLYYFNVPSTTKVRFIINTLTGTNANFKVSMSSACTAIAP